MTEPAYPFLVPFDGHPHPARLSEDCESLLIRVLDLESGPVEHAYALGGPVGSVVRDLWALCGDQALLIQRLAYGQQVQEYGGTMGEAIECIDLAQLAAKELTAESAASQAGAEWQRLKQVEARIATENPWRVPSDSPETGRKVRVLRAWGKCAEQAMFFPASEPIGRCANVWLTASEIGLSDSDIVAWQYDLPVEMPEGWPGSAPARAEAPSPSSGGVDGAGNEYRLEGGR
jgi:hypothetical protein